jgi:molybdopterin converting factor small subunit
VRYFPPFNDLARVGEEEFRIDVEARVVDLVKAIAERHEQLGPYLPVEGDEALRRHALIVVERSIAMLKDPLKDGNAVKLLPPIAGGSA